MAARRRRSHGNLRRALALGVLAAVVYLGWAYAGSHWPFRPGPGLSASEWARPVSLSGVPNLHKVSDDLYRGAQPTAEGVENLRKMGIKTIVNLRRLHSDRDELG